MSNIDRYIDYGDFTTATRFLWEQWRKEIYTIMPGIVESYDQETKRAIIQPGLQNRHTDGRLDDRAPLVNCPVVWPSGGGATLIFPLQQGDPVVLWFSMRGLTSFKDTFKNSAPDRGRFFAKSDAIAYAGFGGLNITPASDNGPSLQTEDGTMSIHFDQKNIVINIPEGANVHVGGEGGQELATKSFVQNIYNKHIHSTSVGPSGPPITPSPVKTGFDITKKTKGE